MQRTQQTGIFQLIRTGQTKEAPLNPCRFSCSIIRIEEWLSSIALLQLLLLLLLSLLFIAIQWHLLYLHLPFSFSLLFMTLLSRFSPFGMWIFSIEFLLTGIKFGYFHQISAIFIYLIDSLAYLLPVYQKFPEFFFSHKKSFFFFPLGSSFTKFGGFVSRGKWKWWHHVAYCICGID